jgi:cytochrome c-type protein NapB
MKRIHRTMISRAPRTRGHPQRRISCGEAKPPMAQPTDNKDVFRGRSHAQQQPAIPREIVAYPHDKRANGCPARSRTACGAAMPVGVSHYVARDHATLGRLPPHGYFRAQRDVPQAAEKPLLGNTFADVEDVRFAPRTQPAAHAALAAEIQGHAMRGLLNMTRAILDQRTRGQCGIVRNH